MFVINCHNRPCRLFNFLYTYLTSYDLLKESKLWYESLLLPVGWSLYHDGCIVALYKLIKFVEFNEAKIVIEKQIVFESSSLKVSYYVNQKRRNPENLGLQQLTYPLDTLQITETLQLFEQKEICQGGPSIIHFSGMSF